MKKLILYAWSLILIVNIASIRAMNQAKNIDANKKLVDAFNDRSRLEDKILELVKKALNEGADINYNAGLEGTALMRASSKNFTKIVQFLLEQPSIKIDATNPNASNITALIEAIVNDNQIIIKLLLNKGANINVRSKENRTVLSYAIDSQYVKNRIDLINLLLNSAKKLIPNQFSEFINNKNDDEDAPTALHEAIHKGLVNIVEILLEAGADPNITNNQEQNAYNYTNYLLNSPNALSDKSYKNRLLAITKLLEDHKQKIKQQVNQAKILGECNIPGIIDIIADYTI